MTLAFPKFRLLDLSVALANNPHTDPPGLGPEIAYADHKAGAAEMSRMFPGLKAEDLPDGEGWGAERLRVTAHNGTHIDAPWHYASTMDRGQPAITIEHLPLEWCFQPAVKLDFRRLPDGYVATAQDVEGELGRIGHTLRPLEIVVVNTAAGVRYGQPGYIDSGCGMGRKATLYFSSAACASSAPMPGAGTRRSPSPADASRRAATRGSSGRATRRGARSATGRSKS